MPEPGALASRGDTDDIIEIKVGDDSPLVQVIERRLVALGYDEDENDNTSYGYGKEAAVLAFQNDHHLRTTGHVDQVTYDQIFDTTKVASGFPYLGGPQDGDDLGNLVDD